MKPVPLILLALFLVLAALLDGYLISDAVSILKSQGAARAQGDFSFYYRLPFYGGGAAVLSLLGLHFCSVAQPFARYRWRQMRV